MNKSNTCVKEVPIRVGGRIASACVTVDPEENTEINEQESEYDSASDKGDQLVDEQPTREAKTNDVAINSLSKTICTQSGRAIALPNRALSSC